MPDLIFCLYRMIAMVMNIVVYINTSTKYFNNNKINCKYDFGIIFTPFQLRSWPNAPL